jgi:esterase/lipase superfamily enzyme
MIALTEMIQRRLEAWPKSTNARPLSVDRHDATARRRTRLLSLAAPLLALALAACASRLGPDALRDAGEAPPGAQQVTIYVATTRQRAFPDANVFTAGRAASVAYAEFTVSLPPGHQSGKVEWPNPTPDPSSTFAVVRQRALDEAAFDAEVSRRQGGRATDVGVFVHGYNTNFQEALFRMAQMTADAHVDGAPILFAWPSEGSLSGYVADKDAVTYSRDQLVALLTKLAKTPGVGHITLIGHSMGGWLTAEALRQLRLTGQDAVIRRLKVVLAAPDIDADVFREQMTVIGKLSPPLTLLVSRDDKALSVSGFIADDHVRVGAIDVSDPRVTEAARKYEVQVVDISSLAASDPLGHDRFVSLAAYYPQLAAEAQSGDGGGLRQAGAYVFNTVGTTLSSPFAMAGRAVAGE